VNQAPRGLLMHKVAVIVGSLRLFHAAFQIAAHGYNVFHDQPPDWIKDLYF